MAEKQYYIVRGVEKKQRRNSKGHFLPKAEKYIIKTCPKIEYSTNLNDAKLFTSYSKANYALYGVSKVSDSKYDFDIVLANCRVTINN